jgi:LCP family protein required for cell wall assembly
VPGSRLRRPPAALALALAALVGGAGSLGIVVSAKDRSDSVARVDDVVAALEQPANDAPAENYLLVGSDSREGVDANDPNAGAIGTTDDVVSHRSDTIIILRRERNGGAAMLSVPRDLWVPISGTGKEAKINSAFNGGAGRLAATITESLGIPINHYVEIDFAGFQRLVDQMGGVEICTVVPAQDTHSGLYLDPGCTNLNGSQALAYARSRYYEEWIDGDWQRDGTADLGRINRQQHFIRNAVNKLLATMESDPFELGQLIEAGTSAVKVGGNLDPVKAAAALRQAVAVNLVTYSLPVEFAEHDGQDALDLDEDAQPLLDYFRGSGPAPPPPTTTVPGSGGG